MFIVLPLLFLFFIFVVSPIVFIGDIKEKRLKKQEKLINKSGEQVIHTVEKEFESISNDHRDNYSMEIIICQECGNVRFSDSEFCKKCG